MNQSLAATLLLIVAALSGCRATWPTAPAWSERPAMSITAPTMIHAGDPLTITVELATVDGTGVLLLLNGSYGPRLYQAAAQQGRAHFDISGADLAQAGLVTVTALAGPAGSQAVAETEFTIRPGAAVEPVTPLIGARSIIADGDHWAMVVALPLDRHGNPLAEGKPVAFRAQHPDGRRESARRPVAHLLAWWRLWSGTLAGRTVVAVQADGQAGPEGDLLEIPGWPQPFAVALEPGLPVADGQRLLTVRSDVIMDRYGNAMPDGTQVSFVIETRSGRRMIPTVTINGVATAVLQAPAEPQTIVVRGAVYGVSSRPLAIPFTPGISSASIPSRSHYDAASGSVILVAGPLLGPLGQHVPDGAEVRFVLTGPSTTALTLTAVTEAGQARVSLRRAGLPAGSYDVTVYAGGLKGHGRFALEDE